MLFVHKVGDFNKFKHQFNANDSIRKEYGCISAKAYQSIDNPDEVVVLTEWGNREQSEKWRNSQVLKDSWQKVGSNGLPKIFYLD